MRSRINSSARARVVGVGMLWLGLVVICMSRLVGYQTTAGIAAAANVHWVEDPRLHLDPKRDTLVMFVHPRCPCSRASIAELSRLMTLRGDHVAAHVLFYTPGGDDRNFAGTDLWNSAISIPGVEVATDDAGKLAERFDARTSGQVFLYNPSGRLLFSGGITAARGHVGDNDSLDAVLALTNPLTKLSDSRPVQKPVFGCEILMEPSDHLAAKGKP